MKHALPERGIYAASTPPFPGAVEELHPIELAVVFDALGLALDVAVRAVAFLSEGRRIADGDAVLIAVELSALAVSAP